jgi:peptidoglycan/LPS O-acetylase OafA/YrhL
MTTATQPGASAAASTPPASSARNDRRWFAGLDGVRFIAAFVVLLHHAGFSSGATFRWDVPGLLFGRMDIGVSIFFVLSGFLLYRPFVVAQFGAAPPPARRPFWIRRAVRIFPAYWLAFLVLLALGTITVKGVAGFFYSFTLLHVYSTEHAVSGITQSWSLATELGFYLMLPFIAAGARRWAEGRSPDGSRSINRQALYLLVVCAGLALVSVVFRVLMAKVSPYPLESWGTLSRLWTPSYLDMFGAGMALAVVSAWADRRSLVRHARESAARRVWLWWAGSIGAFWFLSTQLDLERGLELAGVEREILRQSLYGLVALALIVPVVLHGSSASLGLRSLSWRPVAWLGVVSYGIYLWHQAVLKWTHQLLDWPELEGNFLVLVITATVGSTIIAALSHRFVEEPATQIVRSRLRKSAGSR